MNVFQSYATLLLLVVALSGCGQPGVQTFEKENGAQSSISFKIVKAQYEPDERLIKTFERLQNKTVYIDSEALLTEADIRATHVEKNPPAPGSFTVIVSFTEDGASKFSRITEENIDRLLAILVNDEVYWAPVIKDKLPGGSCGIMGFHSEEEAIRVAKGLAGK